MRFSWDPKKSEANWRVRGFDFAFASLIFGGPTLEREDRRHEYGERRVVAIGSADGICLAVVYTDRVDAVGEIERRIISARLGNRQERRLYDQANTETR